MANGDEDRKPSWSSWFAPGDVRQTPTQDEDAKRLAPVASPNQAQDTSKPESNPLIAFKHFIDDAFSTIAEFNKNLKDLDQAAQARRIAKEEMYDKAYMRWTGAENTDHLVGTVNFEGLYTEVTREQSVNSQPLAEEASATAKMIIHESERRNRHVHPSLITALFEDSENPRNAVRRWLSIEWFKESPYSPVNLEADSTLAKYDTKWRNAFEDLLEAALDKPITSREKFGYRSSKGPISTWRGPGLDWMLSLQCRGILPPQLPSMYLDGRNTSEFLAHRGLSQNLLGRWCQQHSHPGYSLSISRALNREYDQLLRELSTPLFGASTDTHGKLEAAGTTFQPTTYGGAGGEDEYETCPRAQILRQLTAEEATMQDSVSTGGCPDELGRAVSGAIRSSYEPDTELDIYEQMYNDWLQGSAHQNGGSERPEQEQIGSASEDYAMQIKLMQQQQEMERQGHSSDARCPDDLGREVGDFARQEAARAFADEENGLIEYERENKRIENWKEHGLAFEKLEDRRLGQLEVECELQDYVTRRSDDLRRALSNAAEPKAAHAFPEDEGEFTEYEKLNMSRDLARLGFFTDPSDGLGFDFEKFRTSVGWTKQECFKEMGKMLAWQEQMDREAERQDDNMYYENCIGKLYEELEALRNSHDLLSGEVSETWKLLGQKQQSQMQGQDGQRAAVEPRHPSTHNCAENGRPQVLSTLTTTETTRLPDGSVKTTVVLKRRFADGLEEMKESTKTSFEEPTASSSGDQDASKKGWFWS
jgi:hypothetical protein